MKKKLLKIISVFFLVVACLPMKPVYATPWTKAEEIRIDHEVHELKIGESVQLDYTLNPTDSYVWEVSWHSSNEKVASVSQDGYLTAKQNGTAVISVSAGRLTDSFTVTVSDKARSVTSLKLNTTNLSLGVDMTFQLEASLEPSGIQRSVNWKSTNSRIASVSDQGLVKGLREGETTIEVSCDEITVLVKVMVTGKEVSVSSLSLSASTYTLDIKEKVQVDAKFSPSNATNQSLTWSSSDSRIASVDSQGIVTARKEGVVTITAKAANGVEASCKFSVGNVVRAIEIETDTRTLRVNESMQLGIDFSPTYPDDDSISWSSSNRWVATVDRYGEVYAWNTGTVMITATAHNGISDTIELKIVDEDDDAWYDECDEEFVQRYQKLYYYMEGEPITSSFIVLRSNHHYDTIRTSRFDGNEIGRSYDVYYADSEGEILCDRWLVFNDKGRLSNHYAKHRLDFDEIEKEDKLMLTDRNGRLYRSWVKLDKQWVYFADDYTAVKKGWVASPDGWYYMDNYVMTTNRWIASSNGRWYYVDNDGMMVTNRSIDGCWINSYGIYWSPSFAQK